jgi:hypothetical protein
MPLSMPMWPPVFAVTAPRAVTPASASPIPLRRRLMIIDETVRREVSEAEYRAALESCSRVEVAHYPSEDVVTLRRKRHGRA